MKEQTGFANTIYTPRINATVHFFQNGLARQKQFSATGEEKLIEKVFMFKVENYPGQKIDIRKVQYHGQVLEWNDFLAHNTFAKSRMSFDEFKNACLNSIQTKN